jgi:phenylalanyl-tRNA synthetase beta chain
MQISEAWLRSYVNPDISTQELVAQLTMSGLEVDSVEAVADKFSGVVVAEVLAVQQHPDADRLRVCQVNVGEPEPLQIVCGASNVRAGLKVPAALIGAELAGDFKIKKSKLRGETSFGMLCSAKELGLATEANGLLELDFDAPVGQDIRDYLSLDDVVLELDLTPNRADCLSAEGIAREISVLNNMNWVTPPLQNNATALQEKLQVLVEAKDACPRYLGRLIKGVNAKAETPLWMKERLRRSGMRSLGPLVDITNYVLMELGQPLHVFDASKLEGGINVRWAESAEQLTLLNGQVITLDTDSLVIADERKPLALAGVMGGSESAVSDDTQDVFLECAFFSPHNMAGKARKFGLHTDSSHRFERGVDATLQDRAIERATQLILEICGGSAGPIVEQKNEPALPKRSAILLRRQRLEESLEVVIDDEFVRETFQQLGMLVQSSQEGWSVTPPGFRFDISIEADLIEEIARIYGYNNIPNTPMLSRLSLAKATETVLEIDRIKDLLVDSGYQEVITYSFVDEDIQHAIAPNQEFIRLKNPISSDLSVMRTTLWCGLIKTALHNINRQQTRVRIFETGLCFINKAGSLVQQNKLAGLALGGKLPEQWGEKNRTIDFFDVKSELEAIFSLAGYSLNSSEIRFLPGQNPALHPGQTAEILTKEGESMGWLGVLHPLLEKQLGFDCPIILFELDQNLLLKKRLPEFKPVSKFPLVRRDIAVIVEEKISAEEIISSIKSCAEKTLQDVVIFDIYRGKGVKDGCKSVALGLFIQDFSQTLTDSEIDAIFNRVLETLTNTIGAKLRD